MGRACLFIYLFIYFKPNNSDGKYNELSGVLVSIKLGGDAANIHLSTGCNIPLGVTYKRRSLEAFGREEPLVPVERRGW